MRICKDCNNEYEISEGEIAFFKTKSFPLPLRCKSCRAKRKQQRFG